MEPDGVRRWPRDRALSKAGRLISPTFIGRWLANLLMLLGGLLMLVPFWWVVVMALSSPKQAFGLTPAWWPVGFTLSNFGQVFHQLPFARFVLNSVEIAALATLGSLVTSTLAGYAFARLRFPGRDLLFIVLLSSLMVPQQVTVIPTFILMKFLGLVNTPAALFLPGMINVFGIFFLRQFFLTIPRDLEEAARMDGAGYLRTLVRVILPLAGPPMGALAIFVFQMWWNDFFWSNIFLYSTEQATLPLGLVRLQGQYGSSPTVVLFAAITMILIPILALFLFTQRYLTESLATTGLKG